MSSGGTTGFWRRLLAAGLLVGLLGAPLGAKAVVTPLVRLTLAAAPNPASDLASMVLTITVTPVNGTVPSIEVGLEGKGGSMCTPAPNCFNTSNGLPHWIFTNFSTPMTGTVTTNGGTGGSDIRLYIYREGLDARGRARPGSTRCCPSPVSDSPMPGLHRSCPGASCTSR